MGITDDRERGCRFQEWPLGRTAKRMLIGYGHAAAACLPRWRPGNAAVFAIRSGTPHWNAGPRLYRRLATDRSLVRHGQFALNHAISGNRPDVEATELFDPGCNWIRDKGDADVQR